MATQDITRSMFQRGKRYAGARMQQGRVFTDDDFNEHQSIDAEDKRRARVDIVGPSGALGDSLRVVDADTTGGELSFKVSAGSFYVGGLRLELDEAVDYRGQSDWLLQPPGARAVPGADRTDLVYLEAFEQVVSAVEDGELLDAALAGADTSIRTRTAFRIKLLTDVGDVGCAAAWDQLVAHLAGAGEGQVDASGELQPDLKLSVDFAPGGDPEDLCTPTAAGGYLGAENQTIRVGLHDSELVWGYNNASPLYRVRVAADGREVTMLTPPRDAHQWPLAGQVVEILPWSAVLENGEVLAETRGGLAKVARGYEPTGGTLELDRDIGLSVRLPSDVLSDLPADHPARTRLESVDYVFMRVWDRGSDLLSTASTPVTGALQDLAQTGLRVRVDGSDLAADAHWTFSVRPETPHEVQPRRFMLGSGGAPPNGVRRFFAPLARITWHATGEHEVRDCRHTFRPLTRNKNCCSILVGDGTHSHGDVSSINEALARLPEEGGEICVLPGDYAENVVIDGMHDVTLKGCGSRSRVLGEQPDEPTILVRGSSGVRVQGLFVQGLEHHALSIGPGGFGAGGKRPRHLGKAAARDVALESLTIESRDMAAVQAAGVVDFRMEHCDVSALPREEGIDGERGLGLWPAVALLANGARLERNRIVATKGGSELQVSAGGVQLLGGSRDVLVRDNIIVGGAGNGITLGHTEWVADSRTDELEILDMVVEEADVRGGPAAAGRERVVTGDWEAAVAGTYWPGGWLVRGDCCPETDPSAPGPTDPDGNPLRPISGGDLRRIRIEHNRIQRCGAGGVAVARFFDLDADPEMIGVEDLAVVGNDIADCLYLPQVVIPLPMRAVSGFGAIALAAVRRSLIADNDILGNGARHHDPSCGVFVLLAESLEIRDNRIDGNGLHYDPADPARPGARGGIVVELTQPELDGGRLARAMRHTRGLPALRVCGNTVHSPDGPALSVAGLGGMDIQQNQLAMQGRSFAHTLALALHAARLDLASGESGVFMGLIRSIALELTGSTVRVINLGPNPLQPVDDELASLLLPLASDAAEEMIKGSLLHGPLTFNDNNVHLDLVDSERTILLASTLLISHDDVSVSGNRFECLTDRDLIMANLLVSSAATRVNHNYCEEGPENAFLSGMTVGALNDTSHNQGMHCFLTIGPPLITIDGPNQSYATLGALYRGEADPCEELKKWAEGIGFQMFATTQSWNAAAEGNT